MRQSQCHRCDRTFSALSADVIRAISTSFLVGVCGACALPSLLGSWPLDLPLLPLPWIALVNDARGGAEVGVGSEIGAGWVDAPNEAGAPSPTAPSGATVSACCFLALERLELMLSRLNFDP